MADFEFIKVGVGASLCINGFLFTKGRGVVGGDLYYYYCKSKCKSSVQVKLSVPQLSTLKDLHNHPDHREEIQKLKIIQSIRDRAATEPLTSMHDIYRYSIII
jgi:hypothetical protein